MQRKIKIDFDPNDKAKIIRILEQQQSYGYSLKDVSELFGIMTFESTYDTSRYAVREKKAYRDILPDVEGWISKGDIGPYRIFSTNDPTIADYPTEELSGKDLQKKSIVRNFLLLVLYMVCGGLIIWSFISEYFSSTAALFEMQLMDILEPLCLLLSVLGILVSLFTVKKPVKPMRNPSWFKNYVLPWILIPVILVIICGAVLYVLKLEDPRPATEAPFQAPIESTSVQHTLLGQIITAGNEFLYIARSEETALALYEEALDDHETNRGRWYSPYFWNFNVYSELDTTHYKNIDKALLMDEDKESYDLKIQGVLVLIDSRLYGITFDKETTTAEFILNQLNLKIKNQ